MIKYQKPIIYLVNLVEQDTTKKNFISFYFFIIYVYKLKVILLLIHNISKNVIDRMITKDLFDF